MIGVYRPPNTNIKHTLTIIENMVTKKNIRKVIIGGDMNVNVGNNNITGRDAAKDFLNTMKSFGMNICNDIIHGKIRTAS